MCTQKRGKVGAVGLGPRTSLSGAATFTGQHVIHILTAVAKLRGLVPEFALSPFVRISQVYGRFEYFEKAPLFQFSPIESHLGKV